MTTRRMVTEGVEKGHNYSERRGPNWGSCTLFVCAECSCLLYPLWMKPLIAVSGAVSQKCVMRKRQDVNVLSRKKRFHGQMSWGMKVTEKNWVSFCERPQSIFSTKGQCESQWCSTHCLSQVYVDTKKNQHLRNTLWKMQLQNIHCHTYPKIIHQIVPDISRSEEAIPLPSFPCLEKGRFEGK